MEQSKEMNIALVSINLKRTLEDLSKSIFSKRKREMDGEYNVSRIRLNAYDIRTERNIPKMMETLKRDGQLLPITISLTDGIFYVINGRTRFISIQRLGWQKIKCEVYVNLDQIEQDYLNVTINTNQKTLTTDEKMVFVKKYAGQLDEQALAKALDLTLGQTKAYIQINDNLDPEAMKDLKTEKKGRERGTLEIETARLVSNLDDKFVQRDVAKYAKALTKKGVTDRTRRTEIREKVKKINELSKHQNTLEMTKREIAKVVLERPMTTLFSLLEISKGSEGKYKAFYDLLVNGEFDEVVIFNPTTPHLIGSPTNNKSEALMTLEYAKQKSITVILVDKDQACSELWMKEKATIINKTAEEYLVENFESSSKKTLLYFNFSGDRTAREFLANPLIEDIRILRRNVTFAFIIEEEWTNPTNKASNYLELMRFFGIKKCTQITTIEQFFGNLGYSYKILWEKRTTRRVALVSF